jgi:hypothetical protein
MVAGHSMPPPRNTVSGKYVLAAALGLSLFIAIGVMLIALATRRPPAPPPMPRNDAPRSEGLPVAAQRLELLA